MGRNHNGDNKSRNSVLNKNDSVDYNVAARYETKSLYSSREKNKAVKSATDNKC